MFLFGTQAVRVAVRSGKLGINNEGMKPNSDCASEQHDDTDGKCFGQLYTVLVTLTNLEIGSFFHRICCILCIITLIRVHAFCILSETVQNIQI